MEEALIILFVALFILTVVKFGRVLSQSQKESEIHELLGMKLEIVHQMLGNFPQKRETIWCDSVKDAQYHLNMRIRVGIAHASLYERGVRIHRMNHDGILVPV